jgi:hypothetical protein
MSTAIAHHEVQRVKQQIESARARGDLAEVARIRWSALEGNDFEAWARSLGQSGCRRATSEPSHIVPSGGNSRSAYGHESFMRPHAMEKVDHRPTVILNRAVFEKLRDMRYGLEDSLWLVGPERQEPRCVEVSRAMWPANEVDREPASVAVNWVDVRTINQGLDDFRRRVIGHAHSQPSGSWPSEGDFNAWTSGLDYTNGDPFVGVVVAERLNPDDAVDIRAFVIAREGGSVSHQSAEIFWRGM